ncbi:unnamed protein product [Clonostachys rhizophaga]|uniref:Uncharacterized protein n=1 Tax=Clonostachys rhizophaga TaxID=160324 RepID=A0A9N9YEH8_9HYPO|nr:unnamed protein product [Clonostachys rhizophaga]
MAGSRDAASSKGVPARKYFAQNAHTAHECSPIVFVVGGGPELSEISTHHNGLVPGLDARGLSGTEWLMHGHLFANQGDEAIAPRGAGSR